MHGSILKKLGLEIRRYQNKDFLKAAMAVCALAANADDEVSIAERYGIDFAMENEPAFQEFNAQKAIRILDDYLFALRQEGMAAKEILYRKIHRIAGDHKRSRTLMRVAYLIISADRDIRSGEREEFVKLCDVLGLEAEGVWQDFTS